MCVRNRKANWNGAREKSLNMKFNKYLSYGSNGTLACIRYLKAIEVFEFKQ